MIATLVRGDGGLYYELVAADGRSAYFGTDWEYPGLASALGWGVRDVQREYGSDSETARVYACDHDATDGTVVCRACGLGPGDFIAFAADWLDEHAGETFDLVTLADYFEEPIPRS